MRDDVVPDAPPTPRLDGRMVRILCVVQGLFSLGWLAMTPVVLGQGYLSGPTRYPIWLAFWIFGVVSAALAFTLRLGARLTMLAWTMALFLTALDAAYKAHDSPSAARSMLDVPAWSTLDPAWLEVSASVAVYCAILAGAMFVEARRQDPNTSDPRMRGLLVQAGMVFALMAGILAKIGFFAWQRLAH